MVALQDHRPLAIHVLWNQNKFILHGVNWISNWLLFAHQICQLFFRVNIVSKGYHFSFFWIPLFLPHFLKPVDTKFLRKLGSSFMYGWSLLEKVAFHAFVIKFFKKQNTCDIRIVLFVIKQKYGIKWSKWLAICNKIHYQVKNVHNWNVNKDSCKNA